MPSNIEQYRQMENELQYIRLINGQEESDEEDSLLDSMDLVWRNMNKSERQAVNQDPPSPLLGFRG